MLAQCARRRPRSLVLMIGAVAIHYGLTGPAYAEELAARRARLAGELRQALDQQDRWLGSSANSQAWRAWLRNDELRAALATDQDHDRIALDETLARYASDKPGLDDKHFVKVRTKLTEWLDALGGVTPTELATLARTSAGAALLIPSSERLDASRREAVAALTRLHALLSAWPNTGPAWRAFLSTDALARHLAGPHQAIQLAQIEDALLRLQAGHLGLERPALREFHARLSSYARQLRLARLDDPTAEVAGRLEIMAAQLDKHGRRHRQSALDEIGAQIAWCEAHGVATPVVQAVRRSLAQPNVFAQLSGAVILSQFERELDEQVPISGSQNGATVNGTGRLRGRVAFELVPNEREAAIRLLFAGQLHTDIVGSSGPVGFGSRGFTAIDAEQVLLADGQVIRALPATAAARTNLQVTGVWSQLERPLLDRIVRRIGSKRLAEARPSSETNASRQAEENFRQRFNTEAAQLVGEINRRYTSELRVPLTAERIFPGEVRLSTTHDHLCLRATQAGSGQLAAPSRPPALDASAPIAMAIHESAINNTTETTLSGKTIQSYDLAAVLEQMLGEAPEGFDTVDGIPWALTTADKGALEVRFTDEGLRVTVRCVKLAAGHEELNIPLAVSARYVPKIDGAAVVFMRQGELTILGPCMGDPTSDCEPTPAQEAVRERFEMLFQEEMRFSGDQVPGEFPGKEDLVPKQFQTFDGGWLVVALEFKQPTAIAGR